MALAAVPCVASVNIAQARANDVIVIHCHEDVSSENLDRICKYARICFPNPSNGIMVLPKGLALEIVRPS